MKREHLAARVDGEVLAGLRALALTDQRTFSRLVEFSCRDFVLRDRIATRLAELTSEEEKNDD